VSEKQKGREGRSQRKREEPVDGPIAKKGKKKEEKKLSHPLLASGTG